MVGLSWFWIGLAATVPVAGALLVSLPFWLKPRRASGASWAPTLGNVFGTTVIFMLTVASIGREYNAVQAFVGHCVKLPCAVHPDPFTRFAIYGFIGMFQIAGLYMVSLKLEERVRRKASPSAWSS